MPAGRSSPRRLLLALAALATAAVVALPLLWIALPDPAPLARETPRTTALIEQRRDEAKERHRAFRPRQAWVGLDRISPRLVRAVLASEDANFWGHDGIDWDAVQDAARRDLEQRRFAVGASTITQQLAKNLWYGTEKSLWRKVKEAVLARKLERALSKRRILALYLNVAEWGDGVFGIEAGARARFGTSAAGLDTAQAVVMASMLPAPRRVDLSHPSTWLKRRSRRLLDRLRAAGRISADEHRHASAELDRILAGPAPRDDREEPPEEEAAPLPTASGPLAADAASPDAPSPVAKAAAP
ncbi:biosynthetic peptidoglycan transglycosylase, partial [Anaeromyxobacter oryzisoli]|uniref:biosynthetic peptidoglycan transglycosylase n=1 Tax=Anaeromyxobacter oryzisoli TaxID=2925408 RepID=UPI001F576301